MKGKRRFIDAPKFMKKAEITGKERGNIYHMLFEMMPIPKMDEYNRLVESKDLRDKYIEKYISEVLAKEILTEEQIKSVDADLISAIFSAENFNMFSKMVQSEEKGLLYKEESFYTLIDIEGESVLVQGIVDAYFKYDNDLYIIDYKTDRTNEEGMLVTELDLVNRYKSQLKLYADALKKDEIISVNNVYMYIYSVTLKKFIEISE